MSSTARAAAIPRDGALAITPCVIQSGVGRKIACVYIAVCVISALFTKWPCKSVIVETHSYTRTHTHTHTHLLPLVFIFVSGCVQSEGKKNGEIVRWWSSFNAYIYSSFFPPSFCISLQKSISEFDGGFRWAHDAPPSASAHRSVWYLIIHIVQRWKNVVHSVSFRAGSSIRENVFRGFFVCCTFFCFTFSDIIWTAAKNVNYFVAVLFHLFILFYLSFPMFSL